MSCYDAEAIYDRSRHAYRVVYPPDGRGLISEHVTDAMIRDCIPSHNEPTIPHNSQQVWRPAGPLEFKLGDTVEIQWRKQPSHPFGWWYGHITGNMPTCHMNRTGAVHSCVALSPVP